MTDSAQESAQLRSTRFRHEREADWLALEALMAKVAKKTPRSLTEEELLRLPRLYRSTLSALSVARASSLDKAGVAYLESLCTQAYFVVYGTRTTFQDRIGSFFRQDWPAAAQLLWRETIVAALITIVAAMVGYALTISDPDWFYTFIPDSLAGDRSPAATTEYLRSTLYDGGDEDGLSTFATFLFTHNSQVALLAFALGFAFCIPTIFLLIYNGTILGAFIALFASRSLGVEVTGWLLIHGVTELFAIVLAGAAGLSIGWAIAHPGEQSRIDAAANAARPAALILAGVIVMLFLAAILEGFGRQLITSDGIRFLIAGTTATLWAIYFYLSGRRELSHD